MTDELGWFITVDNHEAVKVVDLEKDSAVLSMWLLKCSFCVNCT